MASTFPAMALLTTLALGLCASQRATADNSSVSGTVEKAGTAATLLPRRLLASIIPDAPAIAIDVGHSRQAAGATSARGKPEFEFNRDLALAISQTLSARHVKTFEIGADGNSVDPENRPLDAGARGASFFLSIHHDSTQPQYLEDWNWQGNAQRYSDRFAGFSLFVSRKNKQLSASLKCASAIGAALKQAGLKASPHHAEPIDGEHRQWADQANGVYYHDNLIVLKNAKMPAVLLEAGVIVNRDEELRLLDPAMRRRISLAVTTGLGTCGALK